MPENLPSVSAFPPGSDRLNYPLYHLLRTMSEGELVCVSCNKKIAKEMLVTPEHRCPFCGYRVFKKSRPPIVRKVISK
jgi:DNA-directed RNA polymerase subunit RPC12/RpoP